MNNVLFLAVITSVCYGIAGPMAKVGFGKGLHPDGFAFSYALGLCCFILVTTFQRGVTALYPTSSSFWWSMAAGALCAIGFKANALAMAAPASILAVVLIVVATYPLISAGISLSFLDEAKNIFMTKFVIGACLVIVGGYLVSTSVR